jgi:branched-chain amino acid transport system ATP-binding protein
MWLEVDDVHAHYGKSHVLQGVSLSVDRGETVCLLGRNGVGKSTTLKAIMGLLSASGGTVTFKGRSLQRLKPWTVARLGLGYVPENRRIFPTVTVHENLMLGVKEPISNQVSPWTIERVYDCMPRLRERSEQIAGTLSGGEQQVLSIGRTLVGNPEALLIDEPTEGLAPMIVEQVERILVEVQKSGVAILLVEQGIETALALASRAYVMAKGTIAWSGSVDALKADPNVCREFLSI